MKKTETEHNTPIRLANQITFNAGSDNVTELFKNHHSEVMLVSADQDVVIPEHSVPATVLLTVLEGEIDFTIAEARHTLAAGDAVILNPHTRHSLKALKPFKVYLVKLNQ